MLCRKVQTLTGLRATQACWSNWKILHVSDMIRIWSQGYSMGFISGPLDFHALVLQEIPSDLGCMGRSIVSCTHWLLHTVRDFVAAHVGALAGLWCRPAQPAYFCHHCEIQPMGLLRKIEGCACAGNAGNVFPATDFKGKPLVSDPGMHHGTCVTPVLWCMLGSLTRGGGENNPDIHGACATCNFAHLVRGPYNDRCTDIFICSLHTFINVPLTQPPTHLGSFICAMQLESWLASEDKVSPVADVPNMLTSQHG